MTASEALDIMLAIYREFGVAPSLKDLQRFRDEHLPDSPPYKHPVIASVAELEDAE